MVSAKQVAEYFLSKDSERKLFNHNNERLNDYLFLAQVVHLAKYDSKLFADDFVAYDNGPIVESIMNLDNELIGHNDENINEITKAFLDKIYLSLENASCEELRKIIYEDPEWQTINKETSNVMNLEKNIDEYKKRYKGLIEALKI